MSDPVRDSLIFDQATKTFKHYASEETLDLILQKGALLTSL